MLWNIEGTDIRVMGSIHITNLNPLRIPPSAERAFASATHVVFETDLAALPDITPLTLRDGTTLIDHLPAGTFGRAQAHWERLGLPPDNIHRLQPGMVAMTLQITQAIQIGYHPHLGIDRHIFQRAADAKKKVQYLESMEAQIAALAASPLLEQASLLDYFASKEDAGLRDLAGMVAAWSRGDTQHFEEIVAERSHHWPATFDGLLGQRNMRWVPKIIEVARESDPTLLVIGALHMAGPAGLPALLEQHGLTMRLEPWLDSD